MVGPVVPIPLPQAAIDELTNVEVTQTAERGKPGGFRLTFNLSKHSPLHTIFLLTGGAVPPVLRTLIVATINGTPYVLMDGVITKQDVRPGTDASHDTLDITGVDLTAVMGWIDFSGIPYPAMPIEARVALIVAKYALFGIVPLVIPSILFEAPIPTDKIPKHKGTDLALPQHARGTRRLRVLPRPRAAAGHEHRVLRARRSRWASRSPRSASTWTPTPTSSRCSFTLDTEEKTLPVTFIQDLLTKIPIPIPIPDITPLNPLLGADPAAGQEDRVRHRQRQAIADPGRPARHGAGAPGRPTDVVAAPARSTSSATGGRCRPGGWSACAAPGRPSTDSTSSSRSRTRSSAASTSRSSR